jgi:hypothetical protein
VNFSTLAPALVAAVILSACAPNQPPPLASTPVASAAGDRIISGPAPVPSAGSLPDSGPNYMQVGRDPVPNFPDSGALGSPDEAPYGSY